MKLSLARSLVHDLSPVLLLSLSLVLAAACGDAPTDPAAREIGDGYAEIDAPTFDPVIIPEGSPKVAFLGDSLTAGLHLPADVAYPAELQRRLLASGQPFELINAGVSGDTTRGGLARLPWLLKKTSPDIVVVALGANDGLRGVNLKATAENLRAILAQVEAAGAKALLLGMNVPSNLGEYAEDFAAMYPRIADALNVPLVPYFMENVGGHPEMNLADGMHPNPEGHRALAANVEEALRERLR
jgi:acyl-CoA thioesterase-1